jgi:hypothetical protein
MRIYIWNDGSWIDSHDFDIGKHGYKGGAYDIVIVPNHVDPNELDEWVLRKEWD